jgi:glutamate-1-semialdehyde 2,1-aminomutase
VALGSAQSLYAKALPGFKPDISVFGKVIGGGMPLAAVAGRAPLMELLAPTGPVYQAGTLSGNPVAVAAGIATLESLTPEVYRQLDATANVIADATSSALAAEGVEHVEQRAGNLFSFVFAAESPHDYEQVKRQQAFRYPPFFHAMLDAGVSLPPSVFEAWFVNAAMDDAAVDRVLSALPAAARAAATAQPA